MQIRKLIVMRGRKRGGGGGAEVRRCDGSEQRLRTKAARRTTLAAVVREVLWDAGRFNVSIVDARAAHKHTNTQTHKHTHKKIKEKNQGKRIQSEKICAPFPPAQKTCLSAGYVYRERLKLI